LTLPDNYIVLKSVSLPKLMEKVHEYKEDTTNYTIEGFFSDAPGEYVSILSTWDHTNFREKKKKRNIVTTFVYNLVKREWMEDKDQALSVGEDPEPVWDKIAKQEFRTDMTDV
jgi:hypothetical protein